MFDVEKIDSTFKFTIATVATVVDEVLRELDKTHLKQDVKDKVALNVLKQNFTISQVWERLGDKEKKAIFPLLPVEDIVELKQEGVSFKFDD